MEDEWTKVISGDRLIEFTHADLPEEEVFLTAQLAGHDVVFSIVRHAVGPFNRERVERHFNYEFPSISH
jgi:hypothetical protein